MVAPRGGSFVGGHDREGPGAGGGRHPGGIIRLVSHRRDGGQIFVAGGYHRQNPRLTGTPVYWVIDCRLLIAALHPTQAHIDHLEVFEVFHRIVAGLRGQITGSPALIADRRMFQIHRILDACKNAGCIRPALVSEDPYGQQLGAGGHAHGSSPVPLAQNGSGDVGAVIVLVAHVVTVRNISIFIHVVVAKEGITVGNQPALQIRMVLIHAAVHHRHGDARARLDAPIRQGIPGVVGVDGREPALAPLIDVVLCGRRRGLLHMDNAVWSHGGHRGVGIERLSCRLQVAARGQVYQGT